MLALALSIVLLQAAPLHAPPVLRIKILVEATPESPGVVAAALAETARVWARYTVDVRASSETLEGATGVIPLRVKFSGVRERGGTDTSLGSIPFHESEPLPIITLYPGAVRDLIANASWGSHWGPNSFPDVVIGRVLGKALAHEIGHFLLRSRCHSRTGLMRASHSIVDLVDLGDPALSLSTEEQAQLEAAFALLRRAVSASPVG